MPALPPLHALSAAFVARWPLGARGAASVGVPLLVGVLAGRADLGAIASLGGLAGVYAGDAPRRHRLRVVAAVGLALTVLVPLSGLAAWAPWLSIVFVGLAAAGTSFACLATRVPPPREYLIVLAVLVASGEPVGPADALVHGAFVAAGALTGFVVSSVIGPGDGLDRVTGQVWDAVGDVLRTAGTSAAADTRRKAVGALSRGLETSRQTRVGRSAAALRSLAVADLVLASALSVSFDATEPLAAEAWQPELDDLRSGHPAAPPAHCGLRRAFRDANLVLAGHGVGDTEATEPRVGEKLRQALTPRAVVLPAAARIGVAVAAGVLVGRLLGLAHAYWVGLTVAAVLQASNVTLLLRRSAHRTVGTAAGVALAAAVFAGGPSSLVIAVVAMVAQFVAEVFLPVVYGVGVAFVTLVPLFQYALAVPGIEFGSALGARLLDTVIGAVLAVVLRVVLWPRATTARLPQVQARSIRAAADVFRRRWLDFGDTEEPRRRLRETVLDLRSVAEDARADRLPDRRAERADQVTYAVDELALLAFAIPYDRPTPPAEAAEAFLRGLDRFADALERGTLTHDAEPTPIRGYPRISAANHLLSNILGAAPGAQASGDSRGV
ncbi:MULTISPECIES: FUSC family protein [unclassified Amycolatopsis]|uniref:FUSC family protein n=1 Tax=unclassified Amycolatopsis TaxID=2618356 RepID=UPI001C6A8089|nr:FUSC family protein [Amycolatopsis sp. DSM 110486]QYN20219.1 FUSC family protein [Amycolatopsis sp. DSM 110486]